jgi:uncharacterized membrane protein YGL010W
VKDVWRNNRIIMIFFGFLLFTLFGVSFMSPFAIKGVHIGTTRFCITTSIASYIWVPVILNSVFVILITLAISFHNVFDSIKGSPDDLRTSVSFRREDFPRNILQGEQFYYLFVLYHNDHPRTTNIFSPSMTIPLNIAAVVVILDRLSPVYHTMFIPAQIAFNSVIACQVFRDLKLDLIIDRGDPSSMLTLRFASHSTVDPSTNGNLRTSPVAIKIPSKTTQSEDTDTKNPAQLLESYDQHDRKWEDGDAVVVPDGGV